MCSQAARIRKWLFAVEWLSASLCVSFLPTFCWHVLLFSRSLLMGFRGRGVGGLEWEWGEFWSFFSKEARINFFFKSGCELRFRNGCGCRSAIKWNEYPFQPLSLWFVGGSWHEWVAWPSIYRNTRSFFCALLRVFVNSFFVGGAFLMNTLQ